MTPTFISPPTRFFGCRKVSGVDPRTFADRWIYGSGGPALGFYEKNPEQDYSQTRSFLRGEAVARFPLTTFLLIATSLQGQMTIRIHEADGTLYEVPFNTEYKRVRWNTKRYLARQAAAQAVAEGDTEAAEAMGMIDMGFGLGVWFGDLGERKERENWRVVDWTEEEQSMSGVTYEWIRMGADFEWIAAIAFEQPNFTMWVSRLQRDHGVVAQLEVCSLTYEFSSNADSSSGCACTSPSSNYDHF